MKNFDLQNARTEREAAQTSWFDSIRMMSPLLVGEYRYFLVIIPSVLVNIGSTVLTPYLISLAIDGPIARGDSDALINIVIGLVILYIFASVASYFQARVMGHVSQRILYRLREKLFVQIQALPIAFFNQNKTGDLISRLNNDTEKINQFLSEGILRFTSIFFSIIGIGGMMLWLEWRMAMVVFGMTALVVGITSLLNTWIQRLNTLALEEQGNLSAEVQEAMNNYRVLVAFQKQEFFVSNFSQMSETLKVAKTRAEVASALLAPLYTFGSNIAQGAVLVFGLWLILQGEMTIGLLVGFVAYTQKFFDPLRILGAIVGTMQAAIAGWGRVNDVLSLSNDLDTIESQEESSDTDTILQMNDVAFAYSEDKQILSDVNLTLQKGKTYALVGPTGGGKSTMASLMFRLYDPTNGVIRLLGRDIRSFDQENRAKKIGFILQEPFLFSGTLADNLLYGNTLVQHQDLEQVLRDKGLWDLLSTFSDGLETPLSSQAQVSLGQRQLVSFIRAVLREPQLLILDEATANIDTVTEAKLEQALAKLPDTTTKVVIAHRLNTIENADEIFFVSGGKVTPAGSFEEVLKEWE